MLSNCRVVITPGEPAGIGPDVTLQLAQRDWPVELVVCADPLLLQRALANLMANALRYGHHDITIRVFSKVLPHGTGLVVENHGPELSAEHQARIFDRFWRAETSRHQGSSGLGLSIVRSIMRLHQGSCEVYSGHGVNRFTLRFP